MDNAKQALDPSSRPRDHMANERTFLAWVRTSIGIMAFGFVVEKFTIFIKQVTFLLGDKHPLATLHPSFLQGKSSFFGLLLISLGVLICLLAFIKYKKVERQIENGIYYPSILLDIMLMLSVLLIGVLLGIFVSNSI